MAGKFKNVNKQWELILGYQKSDLIEKELFGYLHKEDIKSASEFIVSLEKPSDTANFICRFKCSDNSWKWLEWRLTRLGKWIYGAVRDITERKNDEETLRDLVEVTVKTPSEGFFGVVCEWLRNWLRCDLCLIIETDENKNGYVVAVSSSGNIDYKNNFNANDQLFDLTCNKGYCCYGDNIDVICQDSGLVKEYSFRGYVGICLYDKSKKIKGVLCLLTRSELRIPSMAQEVFQIVASRASAEMEHLQAEDKYSSILNTAMDCFALVDLNDRLVDVNEAYCKLTGYSRRELLKMSITEIDASEGENNLQVRLNRLINGGYDRFESRHRCKDGSLIDLEVSINFLRSGSNNFVMFLRDISQRKKAEADIKDMTERLTLATRAANTGIWDWNVLNNVLVWNDQMFELYGIDGGDRIASIEIWKNSIHAYDKERVLVEVDLALKGIIEFNSEFRIVLSNGEIKHVRVLSKVYKNEDGKAVRMVGTNWDITMEKEIQNELRNAIETADRANRGKSEFIANMSHEIRTPLNAVIGFSELLETISQDNKQKQYVNSIITAGKSLLRIINDILDMSKIEAGMMKVRNEPMQLSPVFEEIRQIFTQRLEEKGLKLILELDPELPETLYLDEIRLRQVLLNLVGNAVKFTDTGFVKISAKPVNVDETNRNSVDVEIKIIDTGIGIPDDEQKVIFEPFRQRAGQNTAKYGGTGLGLSISKKMTELMNGELAVESVPGNGATFTLTLIGVKTIHEEKKVRKVVSSETYHSYSFVKSSVLIADDIESNRLMLKEHLVNAGLEVFEVENGEVALVEAVERKPQIIIMDIRMPKLSGIEAMKRLRNLDEFKNTPIIALSASNYLDEIDKNEPDTFTEYISKPVDVDKLMSVLERYIPKQTKQTKIVKRNSKEKFSIAPELKEVFRKEFEQKIENFSGAIKMQRMRALIGELHLFSNEYESKEIDLIAVKLEKAVEAYDIEKIKSLLKKCNELCK
jgi:PAS domain S-box-containing protein